MSTNATAVNNLLPANERGFCELLANCEVRELATRVGSAVATFFISLITGIYEGLVAFCRAVDYVITFQCCKGTPPILTPILTRGDNQGSDSIALDDPLEFPILGRSFFNFGTLNQNNNNNGIVWNALEKNALVIPTEQIKEEEPTAEIAKTRREGALALLEFRKSEPTTRFVCPKEILEFNLDAATQKYPIDQPPTKLLQWYDYASCDRGERNDLERILNGFTESNEKAKVLRNLVSKLHYILDGKRKRIDRLNGEQKASAQKALKQEIEHIFSKLKDADQNCIDQTLSQTEDIIIEVIASENPLGKNSTLSLLHYQAAHALFRYRANLIKEILVKDPALANPVMAAHMADIEREVKKKVAQALGMQGTILEAGALFGGMVTEQAATATQQVAEKFLEQYKPAEYLQEQCRVIWGTTKMLRADLLQWATTYYDLEGEDEALAKVVVKSVEELENLASVGAVELNLPGIQLFLEAAGIIQAT